MGDYDCYFLDESGAIIDRLTICCESDAEAEESAMSLLHTHSGAARVQIWDVSRRVAALGREDGEQPWGPDDDRRRGR
jgi:hypothetical protein